MVCLFGVTSMRRVTNCFLMDKDRVLLLQKPSKGWWVAPGGKMESGESIAEAVKREYREETGLSISKVQLASVFTVLMIDGENIFDEWMMFSFKAADFAGTLVENSPEGKLQWVELAKVDELPMAEGDKIIFRHLQNDKPLLGTFVYTKDWKLMDYRIDEEG